jgi:Fe-S-cluster-containing hydrogenase component 2
MNLEIVRHKPSGVVAERDCLRCSECVAACPAAALKWPEAA